MRDRILLVMAKRAGRWIAGAINFIGAEALYGRNWGAVEHHPFLHFELCYYQAIDYAIAHKLKRVEAGAQGEHKLARGYLPHTTYSAHFIANPALRRAVAEYLARERAYVQAAGEELAAAAPFRKDLVEQEMIAGFRIDSATMPKLRPSYDPNNIFAKILRGELPCYKVYEDDKALAFLDIMPRAPGHTLVLPKAPVRNLLDAGADDLAHVMKVAQKVAQAAMKVFAADGVTIQQFNEGAGGQVVFHLHVHVIPRKNGVAMKPPASEKEKPSAGRKCQKLAAAIAAG